MPRINIEDQFWVDIVNVVEKTKDKDRAIGMALRFFRLAQERFKSGGVMTEQDFIDADLTDALIPTFAVRTEKGIEARGSEKYFQWLVDGIEFRKEAGRKGGLISSMRPRDEKGHFLPSEADDVQANPSEIQALSKQIQACPSKPKLSSSSSGSKDLEDKIKNDPEWVQFWSKCTRKVGKDKAIKAWAKARSKFTFEEILTAQDKLKAEKTKSGEAFPHPTTFLNNLSGYLEPDYGQTAKEDSDQLRLRSR